MGFQANIGGQKVAAFDFKKYLPFLKQFAKFGGAIALVVGVIWFIIAAVSGLTNQPQKIRITNITGSSATISWITSKKDAGQVIVSDDSKFNIWPFVLFGRDNKYYDDRDVVEAQSAALAKWIKKASKSVDATYAITGENAKEVYDYKVTKQGDYYVHHVTVFDLEESANYSFKVGNGWRFWNYESVNQDITQNDAPVATNFEFTTFNHPTSIPAPSPAYGKVFGMVRVDGQFLTEDESKDSVVFYRLLKKDGTQSNILSSVTNEQGGWTVDRSNWRNSDGNLVRFSPNADAAELWFNYQDVEPREKKVLLLGVDDEPAEGLLGNYEDTAKSNENLLMMASRFIRTGFNVYLADMGDLLSSTATSLEKVGFVEGVHAKVVLDDCKDKDFAKKYPDICGTPSNPGPQTKTCKCCDRNVTTNVNTNCSVACKSNGGENNCDAGEEKEEEKKDPPEVEKCVGGLLAGGCYIGSTPPDCYCKSSKTGLNVNCRTNPIQGCGTSCTPAGCAGSNENGAGLGSTYGDNKLCPATKAQCGADGACAKECFDDKPNVGMCCKKGNEYDWISASSNTADHCATYKGTGWAKDTSISSLANCVAPTSNKGTCCYSTDKTSTKWDASLTFACPSTHPQSSKTSQALCQPVIPTATQGTCCTSPSGLDQSWSPTASASCPTDWVKSIKTSQQCPNKVSETVGYGGVCCASPSSSTTFNKKWVARTAADKGKTDSVICGSSSIVVAATSVGACAGTMPAPICPAGAKCVNGLWDGSTCLITHDLVNGSCVAKKQGARCQLPGGDWGVVAVDQQGKSTCLTGRTKLCCQNALYGGEYQWMSSDSCLKSTSKHVYVPGVTGEAQCVALNDVNGVCCSQNGVTSWNSNTESCGTGKVETQDKAACDELIKSTNKVCCDVGGTRSLTLQSSCTGDISFDTASCGYCCTNSAGSSYSWGGTKCAGSTPLFATGVSQNECTSLQNSATDAQKALVCCLKGDKYSNMTVAACNDGGKSQGSVSSLNASCGVCCVKIESGVTNQFQKSTVKCSTRIDGFTTQSAAHSYDNCPSPSSNLLQKKNDSTFSLVPTVSAQSETEIVKSTDSNYVVSFIESGTYQIKTDKDEFSAFVVGDTETILFVESNNEPGFQAGEKLLDLSTSTIEVTKVNSAHKHNLKRGINIISFPYMPATEANKPLTAAAFLDSINKGSDIVQSITYFENGAWDGGLVTPGAGETVPSGRDFPLQFGKGYLVVANLDATIEVPGFDILDPIPLAFKSGWNLIGIHGYNTPYTAHSFANSITALGTVTADNVTKWDTAKGRYEGIQVSQNTLYGFDYPIQTDLGYFVRISEYKPTAADSLAIIWAPGTDEHGTEIK